MPLLLLKLVLSPLLIQAASLSARRWGQAIGGWLVGLPVTSGPIALVLALERGRAFAAAAAAGSLAGTAANCAFALGYAAAARRRSWPWAFASGSLAFSAAGLLLAATAPPFWALPAIVAATIVATLRLIAPPAEDAEPVLRWPRWDLPARMAIAAGLVLGLTSAAPFLGPRLAGLCATFPVLATILTVFAQRQRGAAAAAQVLRGLVLGLAAFAGFFIVIRLAIEPVGTAAAFAGATLLALATQGGSLCLMRRSRRVSAPLCGPASRR